MEKFLEKKYVVGIMLGLIILGAFFVRIYHHEEWLYFKMDQARDSALISRAIENGVGDLPLLGPRAGATELDRGFLRLGPIYYYFQYLSGVIFHSTAPQVFAYPDLFFSLLILPLLYVFCRLYFKRYISLLVVLLYAFSFLAIEYSRFAWNPNPLPFFTILSFLALLKFLNSEEKKKKIIWVFLWSSGLAVGSQLNFVGFFSLVGISGLLIAYHYQLWKVRQLKQIFALINLKAISFYAAFFLLVFAFVYTPVIVSDMFRGGENTRNFVAALSSKPTDDTLGEKFARNISRQTEYYTLILTSFVYPKNFDAKDYLPVIFSLAAMFFGIFLIIKNIREEKEHLQKDFLTLILFWLGVFFVLCIPLAFQIRPRFFLVTIPVPFLLVGLIFEFLENRFPARYWISIFAISGIIFASNVWGTLAWFHEQRSSQEGDVPTRRTLILKTKDGVTLEQLQKASDYIYARRNVGANVYFYVKPEHVRPIKYILSRKKDENFNYQTLSLNENPNAQYFAVIPSHSDPKEVLEKKFETQVEILSGEKCGQIAVYEINFPKRNISREFRYNKSYSKTDRIFWADVFKGGKSASQSEEDEIVEENIKDEEINTNE